MTPRPRAYLVCFAAYVAAVGVAALVVRAAPIGDPLWDAALGDLAATGVVFAFSFALGNSSLYDPYWSVAPPALFACWLVAGELDPRGGIALALVSVWAVRLTANFLRGWPSLDHEDWRYGELAAKTGRAYWLVSFLGIHLFPTALTFAGSVALYVVATRGGAPLGPLDALAAIVTSIGIAYEGVADEQLRRFRRSGPPEGSWLEDGLWKHSRHPNYFGEVVFWWGLAGFGIAADPSAWWVWIGPAAITALFFFISIPMIDERMKRRRPGYDAHMRRVSRLVPWLRR